MEFVAIGLALALVVAGLVAGALLRQPMLAYVQELRATEQLVRSETEGGPPELGDNVVGRAIADWLASCERPTGLRRTQSAATAIGPEVAEAAGVRVRWLEAAPNLFVGVGLLATFTLLAIGIGQAAGADPSATESQLTALLATAGTKFVTSIFAILISLALIVDRTRLYGQMDRAEAALIASLDAMVPLAPPAEPVDLLAAADGQRAATEAMSELLADELDSRPAMLAEALTAALGPVAQSINLMGETVATANQDTLKSMVEAFSKELGGATARYNEQLADILAETTKALRVLPDAISDSTATLTHALGDARDALDALQSRGAASMTEVSERLERIADAANKADLRLANRVDDAVGRADAVATQLGALSVAIDASQPALTGATEQLGSVASAIEQSARIIAETATKAEAAQHSLGTGVEAWESGMVRIDERLAKMIERLPRGPVTDEPSAPRVSPWTATRADERQP